MYEGIFRQTWINWQFISTNTVCKYSLLSVIKMTKQSKVCRPPYPMAKIRARRHSATIIMHDEHLTLPTRETLTTVYIYYMTVWIPTTSNTASYCQNVDGSALGTYLEDDKMLIPPLSSTVCPHATILHKHRMKECKSLAFLSHSMQFWNRNQLHS